MSNVALTDVSIELSVPSFKAAKKFYGQLGFKVAWEEPPKGMNGYMVMQLHDSLLCFFCGNDQVYKHPFFGNFPKETKRGYGVEISIPVKNIDAFYQKVKAKVPKAAIFQPLKTQPWGKKDFRVVDPFGYFLRFNEPWNVLEYLPLKTDYKSD